MLWLVPLLLAGSAKAQEDGGPLQTRSQAVGQLFRLNPPLSDARSLPSQHLRFQLTRTYANFWARDKRFLIDGESVDDQADLMLGLAYRNSLMFSLSHRRLVQADTDQMAITVHELLRIGQDGRLESGKHKTRISVPDYDLQYSRQDINQSLSEQMQVAWKKQWLSSDTEGVDLSHTLWAAENMLKPEAASAGMDWGLSAELRYPFHSSSAFASLRSLQYAPSYNPLPGSRRSNRGFGLGYLYRWSGGHEAVLQLMNNQAVFVDIGQLSRNSYETLFGYRYSWAKLAFEATVIENIFWLYNSPDWGFTLGMRSDLSL